MISSLYWEITIGKLRFEPINRHNGKSYACFVGMAGMSYICGESP